MSRTCRNAVRSILDWLQNIKYSFKRRKNSRNPVKVNATIYNIALSLKNPIFGLFGIHFFREIPLKTVAFIQFLPFIPHKKYPKSVAVRLFYKCCTYLENSAYYWIFHCLPYFPKSRFFFPPISGSVYGAIDILTKYPCSASHAGQFCGALVASTT